jgi:hypothetical protein
MTSEQSCAFFSLPSPLWGGRLAIVGRERMGVVAFERSVQLPPPRSPRERSVSDPPHKGEGKKSKTGASA